MHQFASSGHFIGYSGMYNGKYKGNYTIPVAEVINPFVLSRSIENSVNLKRKTNLNVFFTGVHCTVTF